MVTYFARLILARMGGTGSQKIVAHSRLNSELSALNCSVPLRRFIYFFFFEGPKGRYGPREAWAHMGWVGHPAH